MYVHIYIQCKSCFKNILRSRSFLSIENSPSRHEEIYYINIKFIWFEKIKNYVLRNYLFFKSQNLETTFFVIYDLKLI